MLHPGVESTAHSGLSTSVDVKLGQIEMCVSIYKHQCVRVRECSAISMKNCRAAGVISAFSSSLMALSM